MSHYSFNNTTNYSINQMMQYLQSLETNILFSSDVHMQHLQLPFLEHLNTDRKPENRINFPLTNWNNGGVAVPFPERLYELLAEQKFCEYVSWAPHGRAFRVNHRQKFEKEVIVKYFNQTKFRSFQRQLNLYGFKRIRSGQDKGCYYHDLFLRGQKGSCKFIKRMKPAKCQPAQEYLDAMQEPHFYTMPYMIENDE